MLYYDRIDVSECIDANKTNTWKGCFICQDWCFLDKGFKFQSYVCNCSHDALMMCNDLNIISILSFHGADHHCIINGISKSEAVNLSENADLSKNNGSL